MIHRFLFMEAADASLMGTSRHKDPAFHLYESDKLQSVGLCEKVQCRSYPRFLPRPYNINSVQAAAVKLALIQYYDMKGWKKHMDVMELVTAGMTRRARPNKKPAGGFCYRRWNGRGENEGAGGICCQCHTIRKGHAGYATIFRPDNIR